MEGKEKRREEKRREEKRREEKRREEKRRKRDSRVLDATLMTKYYSIRRRGVTIRGESIIEIAAESDIRASREAINNENNNSLITA